MKLYKAYNFRDKDPVIDELRTLIERETGARINHRTMAEIEDAGGPTVSCMRAWFLGATLRPQNPTIEACGRALGYRRKWVRMRNGNGKAR